MTLKAINEIVTEKKQRPVKVVQFGEGNFLRAFADYMIDILNEETDFNGNIVLLKSIRYGSISRFEEQNNLYTVYLRGLEGGKETVKKRIVTSVEKAVACYESYDEYTELAKIDTCDSVVGDSLEFNQANRGSLRV